MVIKSDQFRALPAYLGGKRRLVPIIFGLLARHLPPVDRTSIQFLDPMCGGGAVALSAKAYGFNVLAGDGALRGAIVARALIENSSKHLSRTDIASLFMNAGSGVISWPELFAAAIRSETVDPKSALMLLTLIKAYLRSFPMSSPSASDANSFAAGEYDAVSPRRLATYLRAENILTFSELWRVAKQVNTGVIGGSGVALHGDTLALISSRTADVLYLDPPYAGTTKYGKHYSQLDRLLGDTVNLASHSLDQILTASDHIPLLVLSYGGPDVSSKNVSTLVGRHRRVLESVEIPYPHLPSVATNQRKESTREVIVIAER